MYHSTPTARDRDRLRQTQLEKLCWRFHRIWSTARFRSKEQEIKRVVQAYGDALNRHTVLQNERMFQNEAETTAPHIVTTTSEIDPGPGVPKGLKINDYTQAQLRSVVKWIKSDGRLRTKDKLLRCVMDYLGFQKRGSKIMAAIQEAIQMVT